MSDTISNNRFTKLCVVCGDNAMGVNFDALTCASCKAFFRRNASKNKVFKCHFNNDCKIDVKCRKFCIKCRLDKCYAVGMKKEYILNEEERHKRYEKLIGVSRKRRQNSDENCGTGSSDESVGYHTDTNTTVPKLSDIYDSDLTSHTKHTTHDSNGYHKVIAHSEIIDFSDLTFDIHIPEGQLDPVVPIHRPLMDYRNQFNELEGSKLRELLNAVNIYTKTIVPVSGLDVKNNLANQVTIMTNQVIASITSLIKMSKNLSAFTQLCENDKISLIKYGCLGMFYMRCVPMFDYIHNHWTFVTDNESTVTLSLDMYKDTPHNVYNMYQIFYYNICREWDCDPIVLDLLTAIILFNPKSPNLIDKHLVKFQQHVYMYLLQRYLLLRYRDECWSQPKYQRLLKTLKYLSDTIETKMKIGVDTDPETIPSRLIREIFSLRSKADMYDDTFGTGIFAD